MRFSETTGCFYPDDIAYGDVPQDAIPVSLEAYALAMARQSSEEITVVNGQVIVCEAQLSEDDQRSSLLAAASAERSTQLITQFLLADGMSIDINLENQMLVQAALIAVNSGRNTIDWRDTDNNWRTMTANQVRSMAAQVADYLMDCLSAQRRHHEAIAELPNELLADYDVTQNWPAA